jgi:hypothetical protein
MELNIMGGLAVEHYTVFQDFWMERCFLARQHVHDCDNTPVIDIGFEMSRTPCITLSQEHVKQLLPLLIKFVETGDIA